MDMRTSENSMDLIEKTENTIVIGSELGHGLSNKEKEVQTKRCYKCGRELPLDAFGKKSYAKDGLQDMCKECKNAYMRERTKAKKEEQKAEEDKIETRKIVVDAQETTMCRVYSEPELAKYTPRQLMQELKARGFKWEYMLEPQRKIYFDKI